MTTPQTIPLTETAGLVLKRRYLQRDETNNTIETPAEMFRRVACNLAQAEKRYDGDADGFAEQIYDVMTRLEFLPNSPTLMNAGLQIQQLSACFVLPVEDSLPGIFDALKSTALIHQSGGGTGFAFSRLRPANDIVHSTHGVASGPVSFMQVFDAATDAIKQGGTRRGANMAILSVDHPDIDAFIQAKADGHSLTNFNLSVAVTDAFMQTAASGQDYALINPRTGQPSGSRNGRDMLESIAQAAWQNGDPGLVFIDQINRDNPTPGLGWIESTNPCGEQPLLANESCTLGSISLSKFADGQDLDWDRLGHVVDLAVRFLDDVIDQNHYPTPEIAQVSQRTRKIGLGLMGFADLMFHLRISYPSDAVLAWAERIMRFVRDRANAASAALGEERGPFPAWDGSIFSPGGPRYRNATRTTIAPTGTLSMIAGCSSGIEPVFALAYVRRHYLDSADPRQLIEIQAINPVLRASAEADGWWTDALLTHLLHGGSLRTWPDAPSWAQSTFLTAHEVPWEWHVRMQATFQRHVDNAVSKTINFPASTRAEEIAAAFQLAWEEGCKGITIYRDHSRDHQVLADLRDSGWH